MRSSHCRSSGPDFDSAMSPLSKWWMTAGWRMLSILWHRKLTIGKMAYGTHARTPEVLRRRWPALLISWGPSRRSMATLGWSTLLLTNLPLRSMNTVLTVGCRTWTSYVLTCQESSIAIANVHTADELSRTGPQRGAVRPETFAKHEHAQRPAQDSEDLLEPHKCWTGH